ncbi:hypothetical protein E2C01_061113 [Portunus trituberculatus]|uniref:Uncharacterized protein n=1 Tax=Portunus trituberculatus TaxID=210409 RepID=A0A5B7HE64_PORTR|nr:hypothetical protein [Portunus trituberculatus]
MITGTENPEEAQIFNQRVTPDYLTLPTILSQRGGGNGTRCVEQDQHHSCGSEDWASEGGQGDSTRAVHTSHRRSSEPPWRCRCPTHCCSPMYTI